MNPARYLADNEGQPFYIGKLAELTGATRKAIRHYEKVGLLPKPARRGLYRVYSARDVFLVHVIKHAQAHGFSLAELRELIGAISRQGRLPLKQALATVERKRAALRRQMAELRRLDRELAGVTRDLRKYFS